MRMEAPDTVPAATTPGRRAAADGAYVEVAGFRYDDTDDWVARLTAPGPARDQAIGRLRDLMVRAARRQLGRMQEAGRLGPARCEEIVQASADEATVAVLARLSSFEGRSRFTTWAYKFAILQVAVEARRVAWRPHEVDLHSVPEPVSDMPDPHDHAEAGALVEAIRRGIEQTLTPHQRRVVVAVLLDGMPIDVLADRLGTTRNTLYKTIYDARKLLREDLVAQGLLDAATPKEVSR
jgi:RNA polymerase sigma-70 factor (ECF subfamily)